MKIVMRQSLRPLVVCLFAALVWMGCSSSDNGSNSSTNHPPQIESIVADPDTFYAGQITTVTVTATDADGDELSYSWSTPADWLMPLPSVGNVLVLTNCCPITKLETTMVHCTVTDARGGEDRDSVQVCALPAGGR